MCRSGWIARASPNCWPSRLGSAQRSPVSILLKNGTSEPGRAVAVAVVEHEPLAVDVDHSRVADHFPVPPPPRPSDPRPVIHPLPTPPPPRPALPPPLPPGP